MTTAIHIQSDGAGEYPTEYVHLWYVQGAPTLARLLYPSKEDAERAARRAFPDEDAHVRYARIRYAKYIADWCVNG